MEWTSKGLKYKFTDISVSLGHLYSPVCRRLGVWEWRWFGICKLGRSGVCIAKIISKNLSNLSIYPPRLCSKVAPQPSPYLHPALRCGAFAFFVSLVMSFPARARSKVESASMLRTPSAHTSSSFLNGTSRAHGASDRVSIVNPAFRVEISSNEHGENAWTSLG